MELSAARHIGTVVAMPLPAYEPPIQPVVRFRGGRRGADTGPEGVWWLPRPRRRQHAAAALIAPSGSGAADVPLDPSPLPAETAPPAGHARAGSSGADPRTPALPSRGEPRTSALSSRGADPRTPEAGRLAGAVVEVLLGRRPIAQLRRWVSREVLEVLAATRAFGEAARLRKVQTTFPNPAAAEALALVEEGPRTRMVVIRCDRVDHGSGLPRWQCTYVSVG